jgi:colicin import membrane protein
MLSKPNPIRTAVEKIRTNRGAAAAIEAELDAQEAAAARAAEAEAKRRADLVAKIEQALPERAEQLDEDYVVLRGGESTAASRAAAAKLARKQLEIELGAVDMRIVAMRGGVPARLRTEDVEAEFRLLWAATPVPWDVKGRSAATYRADLSREAAATVEREQARVLSHDEAEAAADQRRQQQYATRQRINEERKRAAGIIP